METWVTYEGERYLSSLGYERKDQFKLVALRPLREGVVRVYTQYRDDSITLITRRTNPKITRDLYSYRQFRKEE